MPVLPQTQGTEKQVPPHQKETQDSPDPAPRTQPSSPGAQALSWQELPQGTLDSMCSKHGAQPSQPQPQPVLHAGPASPSSQTLTSTKVVGLGAHLEWALHSRGLAGLPGTHHTGGPQTPQGPQLPRVQSARSGTRPWKPKSTLNLLGELTF